METYVVLVVTNETFLNDPFAFVCEADDTEHVEEQAKNAYPDQEDIVWVYKVENVDDAYYDYYNS